MKNFILYRIGPSLLLTIIPLLFLLETGSEGLLGAGREKAGLVLVVKGQVAIKKGPAVPASTVSPLQWLYQGATLTTGKGASVTVLFSSGQKEILKERSSAVVGEGGLEVLKGKKEGAPSLDAKYIRLLRLGKGTGLGPGGGVMLRGPFEFRLLSLYPRGQAKAMPGPAKLKVEAHKPDLQYRVALYDNRGNLLWRAVAKGNQTFTLPDTSLSPGQSYFWGAAPLSEDKLGPLTRFKVLSSEEARELETGLSDIRALVPNEPPERQLLPLLRARLFLRYSLLSEALEEYETIPAAHRASDAAQELREEIDRFFKLLLR